MGTVYLTLAAFLGATLSGFVGMGGGATLLALMLVSGMAPALVVPIHAAVQLTANATRLMVHLRHVRWRPALILMVAALPGPWVGLQVVDHLDATTLRAVMGAVILYAAWVPNWGVGRLPDTVAFACAGVLGGTLGVVVGAVGPLMAPFFLREGFDRHSIVATKAVCAAYLHILKIVAFAAVGFEFFDHLGVTLPMLVAAVAGTYVGKWILARLSEKRFVLIYRVVLSALALRLLLNP